MRRKTYNYLKNITEEHHPDFEYELNINFQDCEIYENLSEYMEYVYNNNNCYLLLFNLIDEVEQWLFVDYIIFDTKTKHTIVLLRDSNEGIDAHDFCYVYESIAHNEITEINIHCVDINNYVRLITKVVDNIQFDEIMQDNIWDTIYKEGETNDKL